MINSSPRGEIVLLQWVLLGMFRFTVANSLSDLGESERYVRRRLHDSAIGESGMNDRSTLLLEHHLKELKLPSFLREYGKMAAQCAPEGVDHPQYLLRLADPDRPLPRGQEHGHLRLPSHPIAEQGTGDGTSPVRIHSAPGERRRRWQQRYRQDPHRPGTGFGRLPAGHVGGLHRRRRPGAQV